MKYLQQFVTTSLNVGGGIDASQTTGIVLQSLNNIDATKPSVACLSWADPLNTSVAEWVTYTSVNSTTNELQGVTRGAEGYSAKTHENTAVVAFPLSKAHVNELNDLLTSGSGAITATLDEDDMASNSATALATQQSIKSYTDNYGNFTSLARQAIINGNFDVDQRVGPYTASRNNDDVYTLDHWNLISDGNDILDVSQTAITDLPGSNYAIKLDVETAKRGGIVQFLEAKDAQKFKGKSVSVSFAVKSANIAAIRCAVLSWGSTADTITSDVVGTWAATPTWAANWTAENTPADLTVTSSWTTVKIENIAVDSATVNNLALAIWLPNEETIGDIVYITQVQMNMGSVALPFQPKSYEEELMTCQRYYEVIQSTVYAAPILSSGAATTTNNVHTLLFFKVRKRIIPTMGNSTTYSDFQIRGGSVSEATTGFSFYPDIDSCLIDVTGTSSVLTVGSAYYLRSANTNAKYISASAVL